MTETKRTLTQTLPYILLIGGLIGFIAAFILTVEKIELIKDPSFVPSCNISPLLSCGSVMKTEQASLLNFPNSLLGIAGFAVVATVGAAMLAGAKFRRWFWLGLQLGAGLGVVLVHWLFFETVYRIGALCPYCMVVWVVTIPIFWYTTLDNLRNGVIKLNKRWSKMADWLQQHHGDILVGWYLVIGLLILNHFWYYWKTLI